MVKKTYRGKTVKIERIPNKRAADDGEKAVKKTAKITGNSKK